MFIIVNPKCENLKEASHYKLLLLKEAEGPEVSPLSDIKEDVPKSIKSMAGHQALLAPLPG